MSKFTIKAMVVAAFIGTAAVPGVAADPGRGRAEVVAEVHAARVAGTLAAAYGEDSGSFEQGRGQPVQGLSRAEVQAGVRDAIGRDALRLLRGEDSGSFWLAREDRASDLTRAEVRAEVVAARATGELGAMVGEDSGAFHMARAASPDRPARWFARR